MKSLLLKRFLMLIFIVAILSSCSITPRYHSFGYHLEWKSPNHHSTMQVRSNRSSLSAKLGADVTISGAFEPNFPQSIDAHIDTGSSPSDSVDTTVVKKKNVDPKMRRVNNRIGVTNFLMLADAVSTPLIIRANRDTDSVGLIIYILLIAPLIFFLLLINRIALGVKRRKLKYDNNLNSRRASVELQYCYSTAILSLVFSPLLITTPVLFAMTKRSLKYIKKIESNISFVNKESKKINRIYFISGLISLTMLLIILVNI
jgi:hypothetical protein